ncbi:unnamed protein product [Closterium sp. NIES-53]
MDPQLVTRVEKILADNDYVTVEEVALKLREAHPRDYQRKPQGPFLKSVTKAVEAAQQRLESGLSREQAEFEATVRGKKAEGGQAEVGGAEDQRLSQLEEAHMRARGIVEAEGEHEEEGEGEREGEEKAEAEGEGEAGVEEGAGKEISQITGEKAGGKGLKGVEGLTGLRVGLGGGRKKGEIGEMGVAEVGSEAGESVEGENEAMSVEWSEGENEEPSEGESEESSGEAPESPKDIGTRGFNLLNAALRKTYDKAGTPGGKGGEKGDGNGDKAVEGKSAGKGERPRAGAGGGSGGGKAASAPAFAPLSAIKAAALREAERLAGKGKQVGAGAAAGNPVAVPGAPASAAAVVTAAGPGTGTGAGAATVTAAANAASTAVVAAAAAADDAAPVVGNGTAVVPGVDAAGAALEQLQLQRNQGQQQQQQQQQLGERRGVKRKEKDVVVADATKQGVIKANTDIVVRAGAGVAAGAGEGIKPATAVRLEKNRLQEKKPVSGTSISAGGVSLSAGGASLSTAGPAMSTESQGSKQRASRGGGEGGSRGGGEGGSSQNRRVVGGLTARQKLGGVEEEGGDGEEEGTNRVAGRGRVSEGGRGSERERQSEGLSKGGDTSRDLLRDRIKRVGTKGKKKSGARGSGVADIFPDEAGPGDGGSARAAPREVRFADFGGIDGVVEQVRELILYPLAHPELYAWLGVEPPRGVLLHGPPGCGKTMLAHAIAREAGVPFFKIAAPEIVSGMSGESEAKLRSLFSSAERAAPAILFIDEIDAITPKRETAQREMERRIVAQLLTCLDDLQSSPDTSAGGEGEEKGGDGREEKGMEETEKEQEEREKERRRKLKGHVVVIGATNRPDSLDPALRRAGRFDREICLGIPDESARARILEVLSRKLRLEGSFDFGVIARRTPGFVGADLAALAKEAAAIAVKRIFTSKEVVLVGGGGLGVAAGTGVAAVAGVDGGGMEVTGVREGAEGVSAAATGEAAAIGGDCMLVDGVEGDTEKKEGGVEEGDGREKLGEVGEEVGRERGGGGEAERGIAGGGGGEAERGIAGGGGGEDWREPWKEEELLALSITMEDFEVRGVRVERDMVACTQGECLLSDAPREEELLALSITMGDFEVHGVRVERGMVACTQGECLLSDAPREEELLALSITMGDFEVRGVGVEKERVQGSGFKWSRVEWSGVEWSGVEWSGVEWSGVEWSGVELERHMEAWRHGGMVAWRHGGMVAWWHGGMEAWWHGGMEAWRHGGMVAWWHGGMEAWWHGGMVAWEAVERGLLGGREGLAFRRPSLSASVNQSNQASTLSIALHFSPAGSSGEGTAKCQEGGLRHRLWSQLLRSLIRGAPPPGAPPPSLQSPGCNPGRQYELLLFPLTTLTTLCRFAPLSTLQAAVSKVQPSAKREGFTTIPGVTWDDVGALADVREELEFSISRPIKYPEEYEAMGLRAATGILLYGPPGCGKTLVAKAIANDAGANFISIKVLGQGRYRDEAVPHKCGKTLAAKAIANNAGANFISIKHLIDTLKVVSQPAACASNSVVAHPHPSSPLPASPYLPQPTSPDRTHDDSTERVGRQWLLEMGMVLMASRPPPLPTSLFLPPTSPHHSPPPQMDAMAPRRGSDGNGAAERVVNQYPFASVFLSRSQVMLGPDMLVAVVLLIMLLEQLLTEMDGLESRKSVYIIAATNRCVLCGAVRCCAVLCCAVRCCAVLCCAVLCCAVLCCAALCCAVLCCAVLCCAVLCGAVLCCACCAVLCCAVLCCAVLCCAVLCCAVLCCAVIETSQNLISDLQEHLRLRNERSGGVEEWRSGGVEEWRSGGVEEWRSGGVEDWRSGGVEEWRSGGVEECWRVEEWRSGGVEEWRSGGVEEWRSGGVEEWRSGGVEEWRSGGVEECWTLLRPGRLDKLLFIPLPDAPSRAAILCTLIRSIPRAEDVNVELMNELAGVGDGGASATAAAAAAAAAAVTEGAAGETGAAVEEGAGDKKTGSVEQRGGGSAGGGGGEIDGSDTGGREGGREGGGREQTGEDSKVVPLEVQKARDRKVGGKLPGAARGRKAPCDGFSGADLAALVREACVMALRERMSNRRTDAESAHLLPAAAAAAATVAPTSAAGFAPHPVAAATAVAPATPAGVLGMGLLARPGPVVEARHFKKALTRIVPSVSPQVGLWSCELVGVFVVMNLWACGLVGVRATTLPSNGGIGEGAEEGDLGSSNLWFEVRWKMECEVAGNSRFTAGAAAVAAASAAFETAGVAATASDVAADACDAAVSVAAAVNAAAAAAACAGFAEDSRTFNSG